MLAVSAVWFERWKTTFVVGYTIIWRNEALLCWNVKGIRLGECKILWHIAGNDFTPHQIYFLSYN